MRHPSDDDLTATGPPDRGVGAGADSGPDPPPSTTGGGDGARRSANSGDGLSGGGGGEGRRGRLTRRGRIVFGALAILVVVGAGGGMWLLRQVNPGGGPGETK